MAATALLIALWSQPGDWFRRPWSDPYNPAIPKPLDQPADYFLLDKPMAYIATLLPPQSRFYQIADIAMPIMPDGDVRPSHSRRAEISAAGRRMGIAHAGQAGP